MQVGEVPRLTLHKNFNYEKSFVAYMRGFCAVIKL